MAKATNSNITDLGFSASQFGGVSDFSAYIDAILTTVALFVTDAVGSSAYAAATGADAERLKQAEINLAAAELWRRRAVNLDANANISMDEAQRARLIDTYRLNAERADERAWDHLAELGVSQVGGVAVGYNETGPYSEAGV